MSNEVGIEIVNLDKILDIAKKYPKVAQEEMGKAIQRALTIIWKFEKLEAPFGVSGELRDRWEIRTSPFQGALRAGTEYAFWVHEGTQPHWPPREYIEPWANKHGIPVFLVQRAIARKGTKPNRFLKRAAESAQADVDKEMASALERIVRIIA